MENMFLAQVKHDKKKFKNITIYYELLSSENCRLMGYPDDMSTINCLDGFKLYNEQRVQRTHHKALYRS